MTDYVKLLEKMHYKLVGINKHSAVKPCLWLKKSLKNQGVCYKQKFYGIQSHRCLQMTPSVFCNQKCLFCWRPHEYLPIHLIPKEWDEPKEIVDEAIKAQRLMISGFGGLEKTDKTKFEEAQTPNQAAISLDGEPTMYPYLGDLVTEYTKRKFTTFIVTNGQLTKRLEELNPLPTQLYVSLDAPNKQLFAKINVPMPGASWENLMETLGIFPSLDTRKVVRMTLIKPLNMSEPEEYAKVIRKAEPDFVEVKSYMAVGFSRQRGLGIENMPRHEEIIEFANRLGEKLGYNLVNEKSESRVALLSSGEKQEKIK